MKTIEFQKLLFQCAVSMMAIDGIIHEQEKEELISIVKNTPYFLDFEYEKELEENLVSIKQNGKDIINNLLKKISDSELTERQELILVDVILKIIEADRNVNQNELIFLQLIKSRIKTTEETLIAKFPKHVEYLIDFNSYGELGLFDRDLKID